MTDPKRWLEEDSASLLGALSRAGNEERASNSAKQRARAAVLLATAGSAVAVTKAAAASTVATTSAPPVSLAVSGSAVSGSAVSGSAASTLAGSGTAVATGAAGTAGGAIVTGAASLSAKFGASSVLLGLAAKWTGVGAMVAAAGVGGYQLASNGDVAHLTDPGATAVSPSAAVETQTFQNLGVGAAADLREMPAPQAIPPDLSSVSTSVGDLPASARVSQRRSPASKSADAILEQATSPRSELREPKPTTELPTTLERNQELILVDRAWTALRSGKPREALRLIDGYAWSASDRQFETEALLIRLEALTQSGEHAAARKLANKILETHQRGRLAQKARHVLAEHALNSRE